MKPTKRQELQQLNDLIASRKAYLATIEAQIEDVSTVANNRLFELHGEIDKAEKELARVMRRSYELDQRNRERVLPGVI